MEEDAENCTSKWREIVTNLVSKQINATLSESHEENLGDPGMYIIVVLLFYSCGIVILMINYMNKSPTESEDYYLKYLERARSNYLQSSNRGRGINRLALQAFNAVNVIQTEEKVTYV